MKLSSLTKIDWPLVNLGRPSDVNINPKSVAPTPELVNVVTTDSVNPNLCLILPFDGYTVLGPGKNTFWKPVVKAPAPSLWPIRLFAPLVGRPA